MALIKWQFHWQ